MLVLPHSAQPVSHRGLLPPPSPRQLLLAARRGPVTALRFTNTSSLSPPPLLHFLHMKEGEKKKKKKKKAKKRKARIPGSATGPAHVKFSSTAA